MKPGVHEGFDNYREIVEEIEFSQRHGVDYTADKDLADPYIERLHPRKLSLAVADVLDETPSARTFRLVDGDRPLPPFQAGQYVALAVEAGGIRTSRPYSISSPPNHAGYYDVTVQRMENGLVSNYLLDRVSRGDRLESSGPAGEFVYNPLFHGRQMVMMAGGSGVTPFLSMIREVLECGLDREMHLLFGNRDLAGAIGHALLTDLAARFGNFRYVPVIEQPPAGYRGKTGFITGDLIRTTLGGLEEQTFYLCGPQAMYDFCLPELERLGIPRRRIRKEMYGLPARVDLDPAWPGDVRPGDRFTVHVQGGATLQAAAGEPLLTALERNGIRVPSLCRCGECSECRVRVLSGRVFQPQGVKVRKSDRQFGYVHSCAAYPLEDLEIAL
jgi:ferredoxin-NADP reductase